MISKPVIFLGSSLGKEKATKIFEADYRPPAKKGDMLRLTADPQVTMVGFIDGVFLQDYPPTPIEVYQLARKENVILAGAASLGALRAVELEKFGMIGIGKIFELYKKGKIDDDDEVAVTFADENYQLQSEAMIDIRYNLFLSHKKGIIGKEAKILLTRTAKKTYFPQRNYDHIIEEASKKFPELRKDIESFEKYIAKNRTSLKELDAIQLIRYFKTRYEDMSKPQA